MKSPVLYDFQIFIEIICRCLIVMYNRKQRSIICKQLYIGSESFYEIINDLQKQQRTTDGSLRYSSTDIFSCRDLPIEDHTLFFSIKKSSKRFSKFSIFHFELVCRWYHTLSNAFDLSRKTLLTLSPTSKDSYISWVIDNSWLIQESSGLKPHWFNE